jgi:hypothetical protein
MNNETEMEWIYIDTSGKEIQVGEEEYHRLWIDRYLRAGGIKPLDYYHRMARITIKGGDYEDENGSFRSLGLEHQEHYIEVIGLSVFFDSSTEGREIVLILHRPLQLHTTVDVDTLYMGAIVDGGDIFTRETTEGGEEIYRGCNYTPRWIMQIQRAGDESGTFYEIPFSMELV